MTASLHVRTETRTVYVSARGAKLTKHAAYVAAAKKMIADRCRAENDAREADAFRLGLTDAQIARGWEPCFAGGASYEGSSYKCRFHERDSAFRQVGDEVEPHEIDLGMTYYVKVKNRLIDFLKFIDARSTARAKQAAQHIEATP